VIFDFKTRRRVAYRLLLLQATWSFERMQGLGFAWALQPFLERLYPNLESLRKALERHSEYFNTQPYVASLIVGLTCRLEEQAAALPCDQREAAYARLHAVKNAMSCSLAGMGDAFFWSALRPAAAACGLLAGMAALKLGSARAGLAMAGAYLLAYNVPALWLRWRGLALGYELGERLPTRLRAMDVQALVRGVRLGGTALTVALFAAAAAQAGRGQALLGAALVASFWVVYRAFPRRVNAMRLYGGSCAAGWIAAAAGLL
jgi:mannose/fructose/N-acetylgalactosamine-specific phosphotransferase system component IID